MNKLIVLFVIPLFFIHCSDKPQAYQSMDRIPVIYPDYTAITIPPNIAPLNFIIREKGTKFYVKIYGMTADTIRIGSSSGIISIAQKSWSTLLEKNTDKPLFIDIYSKTDGGWIKYQTVKNKIAAEPIDGYLTYRLIEPQFSFYKVLGIYQRNLQNFDEKPVLMNKFTGNNCMNCHEFCNNDASNFLMHLRGGPTSSTLIVHNGVVKKVNTGTSFSRAGAYPSWHPSGDLIAFSSNTLSLFFHSKGEIRDVMDKKSDLIVYLIDQNKIISSKAIANPDYLETFPAWSPDGKYLYFCRTDKFESFLDSTGTDLAFDKIRYDLVRVTFDRASLTFSEPEMIINSKETGKSILMPRVSPDGKYVLFCMVEYGNFPIYRPDSDLYILDIATGEYRNLTQINTDRTESFHTFSHESKWFVVSSKRETGLCSRPYFSYLSPEGNPSKPFLMPQKDPEFYKTFIKNYNRPELSKNPINISLQKLADTAYGTTLQAELDPKLAEGEKAIHDDGEFYQVPQ